MELNSVILFVNDLAAAVAFCRDLLGLKEIFTDESSTVLGLGSSVLVLHRSDIGHPSPESRFSGTVWPNCEPGMAAGRHALRFEVGRSRRVARTACRKRCSRSRATVNYWWGRCLLVADPEGRPIALARMAFSIRAPELTSH